MTDNEFSIDPAAIRPSRRSSRVKPLPPGQTRHVYPGDEYDIEPTDSDNSDDEALLDDDDDDREEVVSKRYNRQRKAASGSARSTAESRRRRDDGNESLPALARFLLDRRLAAWLGFASIIVALVIFVVLLSFIKNGALDQALILNMSPSEIVAAGLKVKSGVGPVGAWLGHVLFAESFGIGAFVVATYFAILGWKLLRGRRFDFWGLTFRSALLAVSISIVVGLLTYALGSETFWGGVHGHYVNKWLLTMLGVPGAVAVSLLLVGAVGAVYLNELLLIRRKWIAKRDSRRAERIARQQAELRHREEVAARTAQPDEASADDEIHNPDESASTEPVDDETTREADTAEVDVAFTIDNVEKKTETIAANADIDETVDTTDTTDKTDAETDEPGFEIDVPVAEMGKKTGTVAERLVAEQGEIDPRAELSRFKFPTLDLLVDHPIKTTVDTEEQQANKDRIIRTLANYNITVDSIKATVGPTVTLYEIVPTEGIRIAQIKRLEDDIALSLAAKGIRIIAPMPGKGTVGIEVPNNEPQIVSMRAILASKAFRESKAKLPVALGATISNEVFVADLAGMPHALVAGATGQGKSVGLNALIASLLFRKHPTELKFVLIDPKMVEFSVYERLRGHYLASLPGEDDAIVTDPAKVLPVLKSLCLEMDNRYALLRNASVNKIEDYNRKYCQRRLSADKGHRYLPYIVVIIDEFADLIMTEGKEIELPVMRITQKARAVGIHMIIATQRPSTNVLTGLIKANCPSRIAFRVLQNVDSRTILDRPGAEQLIGRGDMLYSQGGELERMQCAYITSEEIERIADNIDAQPGFEEPYILPEPQNDAVGPADGSIPAGGINKDPLFDDAARFIVLSSTASTSSLQRRFQIGYNRAGKLIDQMEAAGIVGPASGSKPRSVLIDPDSLERILANR